MTSRRASTYSIKAESSQLPILHCRPYMSINITYIESEFVLSLKDSSSPCIRFINTPSVLDVTFLLVYSHVYLKNVSS